MCQDYIYGGSNLWNRSCLAETIDYSNSADKTYNNLNYTVLAVKFMPKFLTEQVTVQQSLFTIYILFLPKVKFREGAQQRWK